MEFKLSSPDYVDWREEDIINDFQHRIGFYEKAYETLDINELDETISFVKVINIGKQVFISLTYLDHFESSSGIFGI